MYDGPEVFLKKLLLALRIPIGQMPLLGFLTCCNSASCWQHGICHTFTADGRKLNESIGLNAESHPSTSLRGRYEYQVASAVHLFRLLRLCPSAELRYEATTARGWAYVLQVVVPAGTDVACRLCTGQLPTARRVRPMPILAVSESRFSPEASESCPRNEVGGVTATRSAG